MSTDAIVLEMEERTETGKQLKNLRAAHKVPAVIYDHGTTSHISINETELTKVWQQAGKHHPVELQLGSKKQLAIIKEVDLEPVKNTLRHVVFGALKQNEAVEADIPVVVEGEIPAERVGLIIIRQLEQITVKALPKDLPDELKADGAMLAEIGDKITLDDLKLPSGVELVAEDTTQPIATVDEPRAHVAEEAEAEEAAEAAKEESSDEEE